MAATSPITCYLYKNNALYYLIYVWSEAHGKIKGSSCKSARLTLEEFNIYVATCGLYELVLSDGSHIIYMD